MRILLQIALYYGIKLLSNLGKIAVKIETLNANAIAAHRVFVMGNHNLIGLRI